MGCPRCCAPPAEVDQAAATVAPWIGNPRLAFPLRPPSLSQKIKDSELCSIPSGFNSSLSFLRLLHDLIGNYFKPSAVVAALGGPDGLRCLVRGSGALTSWAPLAPAQRIAEFASARASVLSNPEVRDLHSHVADAPSPSSISSTFFDGFPSMPLVRPDLSGRPAPPPSYAPVRLQLPPTCPRASLTTSPEARFFSRSFCPLCLFLCVFSISMMVCFPVSERQSPSLGDSALGFRHALRAWEAMPESVHSRVPPFVDEAWLVCRALRFS